MSRPATLQGLVLSWDRWGDAPAVVAPRGERREVWSYRRLVRTARQLAAGLLHRGLAPGEPVGLLGPPSPEWLICCFGAIAAGGIAVPFDAQLADEEVGPLLQHSQCRRLFTTRERARSLLAAGLDSEADVLLLDGGTCGDRPSWTALLSDVSTPLPVLDPELPALLLYTSGTTGMPKGVPLSHANILANVAILQDEALAGPEDRALLPLPLHHAYPFTVGVLGTLGNGASLLLPESVSGPALARALRESTILFGVPRLHVALVDALTARLGPWQRRLLDLCVQLRRGVRLPVGRWLLASVRRAVAPDLRLVASGGARLDEATEWTLLTLGWQVLTGYGLTETAPMLTFNLPRRARVGSAGQPLPGVAVRIASPDRSGVGEIEVRGPNVFRGYWQRPDLTEAAFTSDGWFRTGDLGRLDGDGYLHIVSRTKELIVLASGEKVLPEVVEAVLEESGIVREAAVLERDGILAAVVVPDEDALRVAGAMRLDKQLRDEIERLGSRLRPSERVSRIAITRQPLPRTPIGKLRRFQLPTIWQRAVAGRHEAQPADLSEADRQLLANPATAAVWDWLQARFPDQAMGLDLNPQLDLGVDSLAWVGLTLEIEHRFGRSLDEDAVGRVVTLRDLLHEVAAAPAAAPLPPPGPSAATARPRLPLLGRLLYLVDKALMKSAFRLRVAGLENLPARGPFLLVPNHVSYLDPLAVAAALPLRRLAEVHWAGWTGLLFATPLMRLVSRLTQVFALDPRRGGLAAINAAEALLGQRSIVVWFPEGGRSPEGRLQAFDPGIGMLIARTGVAAVPVRLSGSFEAWPRGRRLPRLHRISVAFGPPVRFNEPAGGGDEAEAYERIAERLRQSVAALR